MSRIVDTHFVGYEWILVASQENKDIATPVPIELTNTEVLTFKTTTADSVKVSLGAEVKGLKLGMEHETKTIFETDKSESRTDKRTITIPPHTNGYVYRKRYNFKLTTWWQLDAHGSVHTVGWSNNSNPLQKTRDAFFDSVEYITKYSKLEGTSETTVTPQDNIALQTNVLAMKDCTTACQAAFYKMSSGNSLLDGAVASAIAGSKIILGTTNVPDQSQYLTD
ncbi:hypothetical protein VI817_006083 [Penicillium citrinum]|uniref:Uncharacterized protein n=1 Tax=Penicillium hetheringtonii TaxID=911720 RepID=A0AAD6DI84_9EURO|nr:hypothetical protein N7450_006526 [Penicillium hetheringtonii]KAK5796799.1 hypothetical protein VI817_006083 [Penicillium citrinum]